MIGNGKFTLEGDLWSSIDTDLVDGKEQPVLLTDIFVGDNDMPTMTNQVTLKDLLNSYIEANSIPDGTLRPEYRHTILSFLESVKDLVDEKIEEVNQMPDFDAPKKKKAKKKSKKK